MFITKVKQVEYEVFSFMCWVILEYLESHKKSNSNCCSHTSVSTCNICISLIHVKNSIIMPMRE